MDKKLYGGVELGGTKTICAIGYTDGSLIAQTTFPTAGVDETFNTIVDFFNQNQPIEALGVGSFGPIQLDVSSAEYGSIYNTPKPGWSNVDVKGLLERKLNIRVAIDTDVNSAALGEMHYGVARDANNFIYLTIGTGIGGSLVYNRQVFHGILNLEMGHMRVPHEPFADNFKGACSFHADCLEGIASGSAMTKRYGVKPADIHDTEAWDKTADYIAAALNNLMMTNGPDMIVLGGGVMDHPGLIEAIRTLVQKKINGYLQFPDLDNYIVHSSGSMNGVLGAIKLATVVKT